MTKIDEVYSLLNETDKPLEKSEKDLIEALKPLKDKLDNLAKQAVMYYEPLVNEIIHEKCTDSNRIAHIIDNLLDICNYYKGLGLFCKLMRYYFTVDAQAAQSYIEIFLEFYDESAFDEEAFWDSYNKD